MSSFAVEVVRLKNVRHHPKADRLDLVDVKGFTCVTMRGRFMGGELAIYVPEAAVVPDELLRPGFWKTCETCDGDGCVDRLDVADHDQSNPAEDCPDCTGRGGTGMLAGSKGNRVKAVRLRGQLSQGILFDLDVIPESFGPGSSFAEGEDVQTILGITKYEPPIPANLAGDVYACSTITPFTDMENIKKFPGIVEDGEEVVFLEKLHGSCLVAHFDGERVHVTSKGFAGKMLALEDARDEFGRRTNFYWRCLEAVGGENFLKAISEQEKGLTDDGNPPAVTIYGEALPCQDLRYGLSGDKPTMRMFGLKVFGNYVDHDWLVKMADLHGVPLVPELYRGPFSQEALEEHTNGPTTLGGGHIREGVVVKPVIERHHDEIGRVLLKSISENYLLRKNATEFN